MSLCRWCAGGAAGRRGRGRRAGEGTVLAPVVPQGGRSGAARTSSRRAGGETTTTSAPCLEDVPDQLAGVGVRDLEDVVPVLEAPLLPGVPGLSATQRALAAENRSTAVCRGLPAKMPYAEAKCASSFASGMSVAAAPVARASRMWSTENDRSPRAPWSHASRYQLSR